MGDDVTALSVPSRVAQLRRDALTVANETRRARSQLKRELHELGLWDARRRMAEILLDPPGFVLSMPVGGLLTLIPRLGAGCGQGGCVVLVRRWLDEASVMSEMRMVRELSERQREALSVLVGG